MEKTFMDFVRFLLPLRSQRKARLESTKRFLEAKQYSDLKYLFKLGKVGISTTTFGHGLFKERGFPLLSPGDEDKEIVEHVKKWNKKIHEKALEEAFVDFSKIAEEKMPKLIAPQLVGFDDAKLAACWQLFCPERVHILLLGDPGTGKTDLLRSAADFAPISSFGLGSGTSGVGLVGAKKGNTFVKGLLPLAHKGLACIDELNLMKVRDRGALLNAMEKGFVTYDKGTSHEKLPAEVRVFATANPKGDRFIGEKVSFLKKQLPFDPALLSRFHFIFLVRRPDVQAFLKITKSIVGEQRTKTRKETIDFIKKYVRFSEEIDVTFEKKLEPAITDFFEDVKRREDEFLVEMSPRLVLGVVRLAKAHARMSLRKIVTSKDINAVLDVVERSLKVSEDKESKKVRKRKEVNIF